MTTFYYGDIAAGSKNFCDQLTLTEFMEQGGWRLLSSFLGEYCLKLPYAETRQNLLITTARALNSYDQRRMDCKLTTYVWISWENEIKMALRRGSSQKAPDDSNVDSLDEEHESVADRVCYEDMVLEEMEQKRRTEILYQVINDPTILNERERVIIELTLSGLPQNAIGKAIGSCQSEVSKNYHRALNKLKPALVAAGIREVG